MSNRSILILTASHLCRNPRVVKEATALGAAGYKVTVMSVSVSPQWEDLDRKLIRGLPFARRVVDFTADDRPTRIRYFAQRCATWLARKLCREVGVESAYALGPAPLLLRSARRFPAALTIVHTEGPLWAARSLAHAGRRVAADFEDWYSEDLLETDRRSRPLKLLRRAEAFALHHCAYVSVTAQSMANALIAAHRCPAPIVLRNSFPLHLKTRLERAPAQERPACVWFSQTVGPGRGLEQFLAGWAMTKNPSSLTLLGDVREAFRDQLLASLPRDRRDHLIFLPTVTPAELPDKLNEFDIGLALELPVPRSRDVTITNKILQYMNAGLAVLATPTAGQREVLSTASTSGMLVNLEHPAELATQLDCVFGDSARLRSMQVAARAAAQGEYCWEHESQRLLATVRRCLAEEDKARKVVAPSIS